MLSENPTLSFPKATTKLLFRWLALIGWVAAALFHLILLTLDIIRDYPKIITPCEGALGMFGACGEQLAISSAEIAVLESWGLSLQSYAIYMLSWVVIGQIIYLGIALFILWYEGRSPFGLALSLNLVLIPGAYFGGDEFGSIHPDLLIPAAVFMGFGSFVSIAFLYLMPNGRFSPRWAYIPFIGMLIVFCFLALGQSGVILPEWLANLTGYAITGFLLLGISFQVYRYFKISNQVERQQTKWVIFGVIVLASTVFLWILTFGGGISIPSGRPLLVSNLVSWTLQFLGQYLFPVFLLIAILRYKLWNIDIIINRALVYGGLTLMVVLLYVGTVSGLSAIFQASGNLVISLIGTAVIAILFQPARDRLQTAVNRLMFGERDNPYAVLSQLGQQLQTTAVPAETLTSIVETIATTLKLPYVAIELLEDGVRVGQAAVGQPAGEPLEQPLRYQTETVGYLLVSLRSPSEQFNPRERQLLADIAAQIAPVASATRLTMALQHSREKLVLAREEERLRIRRDLHDGLGPTLAGQTLKLDTLLDSLEDNDGEAETHVKQLKQQTQQMVADIRQLVYELRPPALDELGLLEALRSHMAQMGEARGRLQISVEAEPEPLPQLPAAIEVAAYRIALEAVTNVIRHAHATHAQVRLVIEEKPQLSKLILTIGDDGRGLPVKHRTGIGLNSMRERAEELGGRFHIAPNPDSGTQITATLPFATRSDS